MKRSALTELPDYFDRYINLSDDVEISEALQTSIDEISNAPVEKWSALGDKAYAPGKWTIKDMLQHMVDTERIFCYRALAISREEQQLLPGFDEDAYANAAHATHRTLPEILDELLLLHKTTKALFDSFTPAMLHKRGRSFKGWYSVADIAFILAGHQRWHFKVLEERYYPLL
ncbi:MAG: DinB family protein [Rhizobacter sp.]|nr:DinB family protein [Ferruginibacter sp.]